MYTKIITLAAVAFSAVPAFAADAVVQDPAYIQQAQTQYQSQFGDFAATLVELGPPATGNMGPAAAKLIPASLASGEKDG